MATDSVLGNNWHLQLLEYSTRQRCEGATEPFHSGFLTSVFHMALACGLFVSELLPLKKRSHCLSLKRDNNSDREEKHFKERKEQRSGCAQPLE